MNQPWWKSPRLWMAVLAKVTIFAGFLFCKDRNGAFGTLVLGIVGAAGAHAVTETVEKIKLNVSSPGSK